MFWLWFGEVLFLSIFLGAIIYFSERLIGLQAIIRIRSLVMKWTIPILIVWLAGWIIRGLPSSESEYITFAGVLGTLIATYMGFIIWYILLLVGIFIRR